MLRRIISPLGITRQMKRYQHLLSDNYQCAEVWKIEKWQKLVRNNINEISLRNEKFAAFDENIFKQSLDDTEMGVHKDVIDLLIQVRSSAEATNIEDSTIHSIVRFFLAMDISLLCQIVENPLMYGLFLDDYTTCYLLNELIKTKEYKGAAKISALLMLQEGLDNRLCKTLSIFSCYMYAMTKTFEKVENIAVEDDTEKEVKRVRVKYLRNPYPDYFELSNLDDLTGKSLLKSIRELDKVWQSNLEILAFTLTKRYEEAIKLIDVKDVKIYKDVLNICLRYSKNDDNHDNGSNNFSEKIENIFKKEEELLEATSFESALIKYVKNTVTHLELSMIEKQKSIYEQWFQGIESKTAEIEKTKKNNARLDNITRIFQDMKEKEKQIWYFENEEKINLDIEKKEEYNKRLELGKKKDSKKKDDDYIPPEVIKRG